LIYNDLFIVKKKYNISVILNSKLIHTVISSEARNLLDSSTYAIIFLPADSH